MDESTMLHEQLSILSNLKKKKSKKLLHLHSALQFSPKRHSINKENECPMLLGNMKDKVLNFDSSVKSSNTLQIHLDCKQNIPSNTVSQNHSFCGISNVASNSHREISKGTHQKKSKISALKKLTEFSPVLNSVPEIKNKKESVLCESSEMSEYQAMLISICNSDKRKKKCRNETVVCESELTGFDFVNERNTLHYDSSTINECQAILSSICDNNVQKPICQKKTSFIMSELANFECFQTKSTNSSIVDNCRELLGSVLTNRKKSEKVRTSSESSKTSEEITTISALVNCSPKTISLENNCLSETLLPELTVANSTFHYQKLTNSCEESALSKCNEKFSLESSYVVNCNSVVFERDTRNNPCDFHNHESDDVPHDVHRNKSDDIQYDVHKNESDIQYDICKSDAVSLAENKNCFEESHGTSYKALLDNHPEASEESNCADSYTHHCYKEIDDDKQQITTNTFAADNLSFANKLESFENADKKFKTPAKLTNVPKL